MELTKDLSQIDAPSGIALPRVLLVDDDENQLQFYSSGLSTLFHCEFCTSPEKALNVAQQHPQPDLLILDIMMPRYDGFELCRLFKENDNTRNIPIIFVTSCLDIEHKTTGFNAGCVDYITKPVLIPEMIARIQTHVRLRQQANMLEDMALSDPLTKVANRRKYNEFMLREWQRGIRYGQPMSLILIDIDFFKRFNDHYGHSIGDDCLIQVANVLSATSKRSSDLFARVGGEEFVLILPDCAVEGAKQKAALMLQRLHAIAIPHAASEVAKQVTASMGVASMMPSTTLDPISLFQAADGALYEAKMAGRNQYSVSQSAQYREAVNIKSQAE